MRTASAWRAASDEDPPVRVSDALGLTAKSRHNLQPVMAAAVLAAILMASGSALAQTRQLSGTAGYLSEWEITGSVAPDRSANATETFVGAVTWKHVGLCSANGAEERPGEIRLQIHHAWLASKIEAKLSFGDDQCAYVGALANGTSGLMTCADGTGVPLSFNLK
jgi:hypothetical protein